MREVEKTGCADGLHRSNERQIGLKGDSKVFGLSNWVDSGTIYQDGNRFYYITYVYKREA